MSTSEHCRAMALEADRLASIVSYGRDKDQLREQANQWRAKAQCIETEQLDAQQVAACSNTSGVGKVMKWLRGENS